MFLVDTAQGRIIPDEELKAEIAGARPYAQWVAEHQVRSRTSRSPPASSGPTTRP